jgi:hypothetical protein
MCIFLGRVYEGEGYMSRKSGSLKSAVDSSLANVLHVNKFVNGLDFLPQSHKERKGGIYDPIQTEH